MKMIAQAIYICALVNRRTDETDGCRTKPGDNTSAEQKLKAELKIHAFLTISNHPFTSTVCGSVFVQCNKYKSMRKPVLFDCVWINDVSPDYHCCIHHTGCVLTLSFGLKMLQNTQQCPNKSLQLQLMLGQFDWSYGNKTAFLPTLAHVVTLTFENQNQSVHCHIIVNVSTQLEWISIMRFRISAIMALYRRTDKWTDKMKHNTFYTSGWTHKDQ